jgi:hypothetical protein
MTRCGRHPTFHADQMACLLGNMRAVRRYALICGAAAGYSGRFKICETLKISIDTLVEI